MGRSDTRTKGFTISKFRKKQQKLLLRELGFAELFPKLEKLPLFWYFLDRPYTYYEFTSNDFNIPKHSIERIEKQFHIFNKEFTYFSPFLNKEISPADAFGKYRSVIKVAYVVFSDSSPLRKAFSSYEEGYQMEENREGMCHRMVEAASAACLVCSSLEGYVYGFEPDSTHIRDHEDRDTLLHSYAVIRRKAEQKKLKVRGQNRLCYEVLQSEGVLTYYSQKITWECEERDLYVQAHTFKRIEERLCIDKQYNYYSIFRMHTKYENAFIYEENILIPVAEDPEKLEKTIGYLLADIAESGEMVILTFLFISQSGTPEGDKLSERLSIDKTEKEYLEMENYNHFTKSDLKEDETIVAICRECGLDHLFELEGDMMGSLRGNASFIKETLQLEETAN